MPLTRSNPEAPIRDGSGLLASRAACPCLRSYALRMSSPHVEPQTSSFRWSSKNGPNRRFWTRSSAALAVVALLGTVFAVMDRAGWTTVARDALLLGWTATDFAYMKDRVSERIDRLALSVFMVGTLALWLVPPATRLLG